MSPIGKLRESLLGIAWTISKEVLANPLSQSPDINDNEMMMNNYVLMSQVSNNNFDKLDSLIEELLEHIATTHEVKINSAKTISMKQFVFLGKIYQLIWKNYLP